MQYYLILVQIDVVSNLLEDELVAIIIDILVFLKLYSLLLSLFEFYLLIILIIFDLFSKGGTKCNIFLKSTWFRKKVPSVSSVGVLIGHFGLKAEQTCFCMFFDIATLRDSCFFFYLTSSTMKKNYYIKIKMKNN